MPTPPSPPLTAGDTMQPTLVIMAAGMGSRYGGLKQIDPVGPAGEIVLDYSVFDAIRAGFGKVVFIIRPDIEAAFKAAIGDKLAGKLQVEYVFQSLEDLPAGHTLPNGRTRPWGTGQAILAARNVVKEPFAVINADDFYGRESFEVIGQQLQATDPDSTDFSMVGFYIQNTLSPFGGVARGYCDVHDGTLASVTERFKIERHSDGEIHYEEDGKTLTMADNDMVSMNTWGFTPRLFETLERDFTTFLEHAGTSLDSEYLLPEVIDAMIQAGTARVRVLPSNEKWMGVTYADDKPLVMAGIQALVADGRYPANLWA